MSQQCLASRVMTVLPLNPPCTWPDHLCELYTLQEPAGFRVNRSGDFGDPNKVSNGASAISGACVLPQNLARSTTFAAAVPPACC